MGFLREEYWNRLPFPSPGALPDPGIELASPVSPALKAGSLQLSCQGRLSILCQKHRPSQLLLWQIHACTHARIYVHTTHTHTAETDTHTHVGTHIHMDAGSTYITWLIPTHSLILSSFFSGNPARSQTSQLNNCKEPHSFPSLCLFAFTPSGIPEHQRLLSHGGQEPTSAHNRDRSGWNPSSTAYCLGNLGWGRCSVPQFLHM